MQRGSKMRVLSLFDGKYEVHSDGTVWSNVGKKKPLIGKITKCGYRMIVFNIDGKKQYPLVHRLVAQAFIPNPENKPQVNHKNGIKTDNRVENLEWTTTKENQKHCRDKLNPRYCKINKTVARKIREEKGLTQVQIGIKYGLKHTQVGYILQNKRWSI